VRLPIVLATAGLVRATLSSQSATAQVVDSTTLRPTEVEVTIANDRENDGTYRAKQVSPKCGKLDMMMPHRANSFNVQFPDDDTKLAVRTVTFDADTLPPGGSTPSFQLTVGVRTPDGGTPELYVVRAREPQYDEPGKANRTKTAGTDVLTLDGVASKGTKVRITMRIVCYPKP